MIQVSYKLWNIQIKIADSSIAKILFTSIFSHLNYQTSILGDTMYTSSHIASFKGTLRIVIDCMV